MYSFCIISNDISSTTWTKQNKENLFLRLLKGWHLFPSHSVHDDSGCVNMVPVMNDLWWPMISGDGWGSKFSWRLSYGWGKTPGKLTWPGIEPGPAGWAIMKLLLGHDSGLVFLSSPRRSIFLHNIWGCAMILDICRYDWKIVQCYWRY